MALALRCCVVRVPLFRPFSEAVKAELPTLPWLIPDTEREKRTDFRHLNICSVDPPGCTDIDDALHSRLLPNGNIEVGVHIADVTYFIRPGSECDKEAAKRATSVYLTNKRIDMVPPVLSGNLCSLRGGVERLAVSTIWEMTPECEVVSVNFCRSVIESKAALMYSEAQLKIDDASDNSEVALSLRRLNKLAKILRMSRIEKGALMLASPEVRFNMVSETHDPVDVEIKQSYETNSLVEEFMLLANCATAAHTYEQFPACAMLRRHPVPPGSNFEPLLATAKGAGIKLETSSSRALAMSLENAEGHGHKYTSTLLRILATRCMLQAQYFASGTISEDLFSHYGLASDIYTHFTSPIRRYSDIIVHRLLTASIGADETTPDLVSKEKAAELTDNLNFRHTMAQHASRASTDLFCQIFFTGKHIDEEAYILRNKKNAIAVLVPRYGIEGVVFLDKPPVGEDGKKSTAALPELTFEEDTMKLQVKAGGKLTDFRVFDRVVVRISVEESLQTKKIRLHLVQPAVIGISVLPQKATDLKMLTAAPPPAAAAATAATVEAASKVGKPNEGRKGKGGAKKATAAADAAADPVDMDEVDDAENVQQAESRPDSAGGTKKRKRNKKKNNKGKLEAKKPKA